jgi:hypothetical protein
MSRTSHSVATLIAALACLLAPASAQTPPVAATKSVASLGDSLRRGGGKQLHILYLHGIASNGPGDFDSWLLRKNICDFLKDCTTPAGQMDGTEYADQGEFALNAPPPNLAYLGQPIWHTDASGASEEWNASAPFVVHWKLVRTTGPTIYVDEINWWPLIFALKCRQIVESDASLVGPGIAYIDLCSRSAIDPITPHRFVSYPWIDAPTAQRLKALPLRGATINRDLKNGLLDWGFSDAVLALGPLRTYLLDGIRQVVLKSTYVTQDGTRGDPTAPRPNQEFVIVSHSLGSYLIFSALDDVPAATSTGGSIPASQPAAAPFDDILSRTSVVYFFANQLRLLELSNLDFGSGKNMISHLESWGTLRSSYLQSLPSSEREGLPPPRIVALNDPSDLLTWTVPDLRTVEVTNLTVKNATHWFGLIESPNKAHDNYARNKALIAQMLKLTKSE